MLASIRVRVFIAFFLLIMLTLALAGGAFFYISARWGVDQAQRQLRSRALDVQKFINRVAEGADTRRWLGATSVAPASDAATLVRVLNLYTSFTTGSDGVRMLVVDPSGHPLYNPQPEPAQDDETVRAVRNTPAGQEKFWDSVTRKGTDRQMVVHLSTPLRFNGNTVAYADFAMTLAYVDDVTHRLQVLFAQIGAVLTVIALLLSYVLSRGILKPVIAVREVAGRMAAGNLGVRVPVSGGDELGALGETINSLADEIARNIHSVTAEKDKLDAILSSMVDGVITIRADGTVTFANSVAGRIVADYVTSTRPPDDPGDQAKVARSETPSAEAGVGRTAMSISRLVGGNIFPPLQSTGLQELAAMCFGSGEATSREIKLGDKDFNVFAIPIGEPPSESELLLLLRDVTSLRQVEIARSQFLGNVSHELKTPLTIIKGFVVTLQKSEGITEEWLRYLGFIDRETDRLSRLVDDVLNLARLRSKRTQMNFAFCEPMEILKDTYRQLLPQAAKYDVTLSFEYDDNLPVLLADADRFKEIIINLVDNAFKYSPPKTHVELRATASPEHLVLTVKDSGPGIPADEVPFLFERFFRGSEKGGRKSGGSGIGLAIVKEIVDAHRGSIRVESRVGEGTRFIFELPLRQGGRRRTDRPTDGGRSPRQ